MDTSNKITYTNIQTKQHTVITQLLKFRHLSQPQIQQLLNHKAKERIRTTLNELSEGQYIAREFDRKIGGLPATYSLAKNGIHYLSNEGIDPVLLKRLYDDHTHTKEYKDHCLFIANIYLSFRSLLDGSGAVITFKTKTDLYNLMYLILPHPDAYIYINYPDGDKRQYFLDVFDTRIFIYKRIYQYIDYYNKNYWQYKTHTNFPEVILICPDNATKKSINQFIQRKAPTEAPTFYLTTKEQAQKFGLSREILEKVEI